MFIEHDLEEKQIFLGPDKKILLKCEKEDSLLRIFPNASNKLILNKCVKNEDNFKCPNLPNCIFCLNSICQKCSKNHILNKITNLCIPCFYPKIIYNKICNSSTLMGLKTFPVWDYIYELNKVIALNVKFSSLKDFENSKGENIFENTLYYYKKDLNFEFPSNFLNLINLENFEIKEIYFSSFDKLNNNERDFNSVYGCEKDFFFNYDYDKFYEGICDFNRDNFVGSLNKFRFKNLWNCDDVNTYINRCQVCKTGFFAFSVQNYFYKCMPEKFETDFLLETKNEIIVMNWIKNCLLCESNICLHCESNFF